MSASSINSPKQAHYSFSTSPLQQEARHSKSSSHIIQCRGSFEFILKDWHLIPHAPGKAASLAPFTISQQQGDQWILQVFPEGKNALKRGNVTLSLRNLTKNTFRATFKLMMLGRDESRVFARETEPAKSFSPNSEWNVDTERTFAEMVDPNGSDWLQEDGSLLVRAEATICGDAEVLLNDKKFQDIITILKDTECFAINLADDLVKLLDVNSTIKVLESGEKIVMTNVKTNSTHMLWKADITLVSDEERIPCHQCILAARSPVFCELLQSPGTNLKMFMQAGKLCVTKHIHPTVIKTFVYYLYSDQCDIAFLLEDEGCYLTRLFRAASYYSVNGLVALCSQYLISTLSVDNAVPRLVLAHELEGTKLMQAATLQFIVQNFSAFRETKTLQGLEDGLSRLVMAKMTSSLPCSLLTEKPSLVNEGVIEREASRESDVDESETKATPPLVESDVEYITGLDTGFHRLEEMHDRFESPPLGSPHATRSYSYQKLPKLNSKQGLKSKETEYLHQQNNIIELHNAMNDERTNLLPYNA